MAIHVPITGAPTCAPVIPAIIAAALSQISRGDLEALVETALAQLDLTDGDPDLEDYGDELDGNGSEEDFIQHGSNWTGEPGCPIADAGEVAWPERLEQPAHMLGGLAGDMDEDAEPWHLPPLMGGAKVTIDARVPA